MLLFFHAPVAQWIERLASNQKVASSTLAGRTIQQTHVKQLNIMQNKVKIEKFEIPIEVSRVTKALKEAGFEAYLVGGCVRDMFMGRKPKDWDVTTNATPEEIIPLFPKTFYENVYGTVAVVNEWVEDVEDPESEAERETLKTIEITPYRLESDYSDHRRPDSVKFSQNILDDLKRRDFSINAIAYNAETGEITDSFGGMQDLNKRIIRAVGDPNERFYEDGLRMLRAVRLHVELSFEIEEKTRLAILKNKDILSQVSRERIRDEFFRIIMSVNPMAGLVFLKDLGLLRYIIPELEESFGVEQNKAHAFDVWTHLLKTLQHSADKNYPLHVRLAALLHDISKPATRRWNDQTKQWTFYAHEIVGSRVTKRILENLKVSRETIEKVVTLVRWHMFFSDTETITPSAVRRLLANVGKENIWDLINVRLCDRIGTGRPKENPYRLRKYQAMIEEVMMDPVSVGMLKTNGKKIMEILDVAPGPKIGQMLNTLLEEVLEDPKLNTEEYLNQRTKDLALLSDRELMDLAVKGKEKKEKEQEKKIRKIRGRHHVE